jgi:predicted deacetylase
MSARYLVRLDDICPTMNWSVWARIEAVLTEHSIKPMLAVVPDNRDPRLMIEPARSDFWDRVRAWQAGGWCIALHGFEHLYETRSSGLLGINAYSEFAGLPYDAQRAKLDQALGVFARHGVRADAWVAPAHTFDASTVKALLELGIDVISDGFYSRPVKRLGALWIPQQMWQFRPMPFGVWTVCYHHNRLSEEGIRKFQLDIKRFASAIVTMDQVIRDDSIKESNFLDASVALTWLAALRFKRRLRAS